MLFAEKYPSLARLNLCQERRHLELFISKQSDVLASLRKKVSLSAGVEKGKHTCCAATTTSPPPPPPVLANGVVDYYELLGVSILLYLLTHSFRRSRALLVKRALPLRICRHYAMRCCYLGQLQIGVLQADIYIQTLDCYQCHKTNDTMGRAI